MTGAKYSKIIQQKLTFRHNKYLLGDLRKF